MSHPNPSPSPLQAWKHGKLTLGFSGGGFLLPYHLGVYQSLAGMGIVSSTTPMAGSSAGSLVVGGIKSGLTLQQQMDSFLEAAQACREGGVNGRLRQVLKAQLQRSMPEDAAARCSDGSCWISVTQVFPRPANKLYGAFDSRAQLIKALLASCHLPRVSDGGLFTSYKSIHKRVFDGGFSNLCPVPPPPHGTSAAAAPTHRTPSTSSSAAPAQPCPASGPGNGSSSSGEPHPTAPAAGLLLLQRADSTKGITTKLLPAKVKPKPPSGSANSSISTTSTSSSGLAFRRSLSAPEGHTHSSAVHLQHRHRTSSHSSHSGGASLQSGGLLGRMWRQQRHHQRAEQLLAASCEVEGAGAYVAAPGWFAIRVCVLPAQHMDSFPAMFRAPAADELSIALDKFQDWPHDLDATTKLALYPQSDDFLWDLFHRGCQDAASWARQQGFPDEVLQRLHDGAADVPQLKVERRRSSSGGGGSSRGAAAAAAEHEQAAVVAAGQGLKEARQVVAEGGS